MRVFYRLPGLLLQFINLATGRGRAHGAAPISITCCAEFPE
jgi:hypothetical protein